MRGGRGVGRVDISTQAMEAAVPVSKAVEALLFAHRHVNENNSLRWLSVQTVAPLLLASCLMLAVRNRTDAPSNMPSDAVVEASIRVPAGELLPSKDCDSLL